MATNKKTPVVKLTLDEIKAKLKGVTKEVYVELPDKELLGTLSDIEGQLARFAQANKIPRPYTVAKRTISKATGTGYYKYTHRYSATCLLGTRPYTDEELEKDGSKLIKQKEKADEKAAKQLAKDTATFEALKAKLGK